MTRRAFLLGFKSNKHNILWTYGATSAERKHGINKLCEKFTAVPRRPQISPCVFIALQCEQVGSFPAASALPKQGREYRFEY